MRVRGGQGKRRERKGSGNKIYLGRSSTRHKKREWRIICKKKKRAAHCTAPSGIDIVIRPARPAASMSLKV